MTGRRTIALSAAFLAILAPPKAGAQAEEETQIAADIRFPLPRGGGAELLPVELVLESLRRSKGYSFVFDSRLLFGKKIPPVAPSATAEDELSEVLKSVRLRLHKVSPSSYAITSDPLTAGAITLPVAPLKVEPAPVDTILVVGSSASLPTTTGAKRLFVLDADDLAFLGDTSPAEAIYDLPQSLASFTPSNTALFGAAAGLSLADLRGLNPRHTLVLMNGRRRTLTSGGNGEIGGADLGVFAEPLLERIEVQNAPAGARFGGSAVAGTINFVTKSGFDGLRSGARLGISELGDSAAAEVHVLAGRTIENFGNLTVGVVAGRSDGLTGADRPFSESIYGFALDGRRSTAPGAEFLPGFGQSGLTERGLVAGVILADGRFARFPGATTYVPEANGAVAPFVGTLDQLYSLGNTQSKTLPNDRLLGTASFEARPSDQLRFFAEANGGIISQEVSLLPLPALRARGVDPVIGDAALIPLDNPFLPQSIRELAQSSFGAGVTGVVYEHRYAELGPRLSEIDRSHFDLAAGLEYEGDQGGTFSLSYRHGRNLSVTRDNARIDAGRLRTALDSASCAAAPGCAPVDFFSSPEISTEALRFIVIPELERKLAVSEHEIIAAGALDLDFSEEKKGRFAAGVELRRISFQDRNRTPAGAEPIGYFEGEDISADLATIDAYAQFDADLLRNSIVPGEVDGALALRLTESPQHEGVFNFEANLDWRPVPGVALFSRQHFGERAPDVIELFTFGPSLETAFLDPCGRAPSAQSAVVQANCTSAGPLGVGPGFVQTEPLATATFYGNPDLQPEKVRSAVYGVSLTPGDWFSELTGRLEFSAAWYDFRIEDAVSNSAAPISTCFSSLNFSSPACGTNPRTGQPLISRDPVTRQIETFDDVLRNEAAFEWRGLDLELRYAGEPTFLPFADLVWVSALHTYTDRVISDTGSGDRLRVDGLIDYPRHRTLASVGVEVRDWTFVAYANRRGRALTIRTDEEEARIPSALYLDFTARLNLSPNSYLQAGVQNITDLQPTITAYNDTGNFAAEFYDPIGRRYFASFRHSF